MPPNNNNFFGGYGVPTQQQMPMQQTRNEIVTTFVQGEAGAEFYPVAAGNTVFLFDFDAGKFWIKSTAANCIPQPLREFDFKERIKKQEVQNNNNNFVSRNEFEQLQSAINQLITRIGGNNNNESITNANVQPTTAIQSNK